MHDWSLDNDPRFRRLASEGCRPRLPWSFRLEKRVADPSPVLAILDNLKPDDSPYVRKSVPNHLSDITKDNPGWGLDPIEAWRLDNSDTAWIARHALRSLIKKGDSRAMTIMGAGEKAQVRIDGFSVAPARISLGERISLSFTLTSTASSRQKLIVDYAIHYVKK